MTRIDPTRAASPLARRLACCMCPAGPTRRAARPDMPGQPTAPPFRSSGAGRKNQPVPGRSLQRIGARAGRNPAEPSLRPGPLGRCRGHRPPYPRASVRSLEGIAGFRGLSIRVERTTSDTFRHIASSVLKLSGKRALFERFQAFFAVGVFLGSLQDQPDDALGRFVRAQFGRGQYQRRLDWIFVGLVASGEVGEFSRTGLGI